MVKLLFWARVRISVRLRVRVTVRVRVRVSIRVRVRERSVPSPLEWDLGWGLWHLPLPRKFLNFIISMAFCCILGAVFKVGYFWDVI